MVNDPVARAPTLCGIVNQDKDFISNNVVLVATTSVYDLVVAIGESLAAVLLVWRSTTVRMLRSMSRLKTMHTGERPRCVDDFDGCFDVIRNVGVLESSNHASSSCMRSFDDGIGLRVFDRDWHGFNSFTVETELK